MKYISIAILLFVTQVVFSQRPYGEFQIKNLYSPESPIARNVIDTVRPISFVAVNDGGLGCFTGIYSAPDTGYVSGNNQYGDLAKAQFFSLSQMGYGRPATIQSVLVSFGLKTMSPTPESISVSVYSVDTPGFQPGPLLSVSNPVNLADVKTDGFPTAFTFPTPVSVNDSFFVGIDLPIFGGDTVAIVTSYDECIGFSGWSWEKWSNGTWHTMLNSWVLDIDLAFFPVMDLPYGVGLDELTSIRPVRVFPNPASDIATIELESEESSSTQINVYNLEGRKVFGASGNFATNRYTLNVSKWNSGIYQIEVRQDNNYFIQKLTVIR